MLPRIFDDLTTLSDATRSRMLLILERHELTVSELCAVLQLPQSTVSRHLKTLADASWVTSRRDGTSRYYTLALDERDAHTRRLWALLREQIATTRRRGPGRAAAERRARAPAEQVGGVLRVGGGAVGSAAPGAVRRRLGAARAAGADRFALDRRRPRVRHRRDQRRAGAVCRADGRRRSQRRDAAGGAPPAARGVRTADVRRGELEALPIADGELDAAVMMLVLHHVPDPAAVLLEAARTLKPRGRFVLCDMLPHDREEYKQQMGHVWLGFGDDQLRRLFGAAGFDDIRIVPLPADPEAKGPALFVASAVRS